MELTVTYIRVKEVPQKTVINSLKQLELEELITYTAGHHQGAMCAF